MYKGVEKAIRELAKDVEKTYGRDILDYLYGCAENDEYDEGGNRRTVDGIVACLEGDVENYLDFRRSVITTEYKTAFRRHLLPRNTTEWCDAWNEAKQLKGEMIALGFTDDDVYRAQIEVNNSITEADITAFVG